MIGIIELTVFINANIFFGEVMPGNAQGLLFAAQAGVISSGVWEQYVLPRTKPRLNVSRKVLYPCTIFPITIYSKILIFD